MVNRNPGPAMEYIKQIKQFSAFSQFFTDTRSNHDAVRIDNIIFKIHSQYTVSILLVGTLFLTIKQFGDPIECLTTAGNSDISAKLLQHWCWLEGSFSVVDSNGKASMAENIAYPGVKTLNEEAGEKRRSHKYYQWVYFVLIIQAILFYVPKYLWKVKEANRLQMMITHLKSKNIREFNENDARKLTQDVVDSLSISNDYFFFCFFCEFLYYIHLVMQMWLTNLLLSGQFLRLGLEWLTYNHNDNYADPLIRVFPRMAKCLFHKYGYSGSIERRDSLCFLCLNIVNEKIFVILWFWFAFLFIVTSCVLVYRIIHVLVPYTRFKNLCAKAPSTDRKALKMLTSRVGNFFVLSHIASNLKPHFFRDLIDVIMRDYFDDKSNVVYNKQAKNVQSLNQINGQMMNAQLGSQKQKKNGIKKSFGKSKGYASIGFTRGSGNTKAANFVSVNREIPEGHSSGHSQDSDEWPM